MRPSLVAVAVLLLPLAGCGDDAFDVDAGDQVTLGGEYVRARNCGSCHRAPDGTFSGSTTPQPGSTAYAGNLTPDRLTGLGGWADVQIVRAMRAGVDNQEQPLCPTMPRMPDMGDVEARAIVAYLRSRPAVTRSIPASTCPVDMAAPAPLDGGQGD